MNQTKFLLPESEIPTHWYNVVADMPNKPAPVLGPDGQPISPDALSAIFVDSLIEQEVSTERWIPIPEPVREIYRLWRPAPLFRAHRLEAELGTPARIYYKYEGVSPAGSHKLNSAIAQAYYNREAGIRRMTTETGAGQWGCSLALAGQMFGIDIRVFMVKVSYQQKPFRRSMMQTWGAEVLASPSPLTAAGRAALEADDNNPGSLGLAIAEAVEEAASRSDTTYGLGSVLNHVLLHQTVIGLEAKKQFELAGDYPDMIFAPCGGGSNFGGVAFPFFADKAAGRNVRLVAVEPASCPSLTRGHYSYDYGDTAGLTPLMKQYTLGHDFMPPSIHAGGLRYHGASTLVSQLVHEGLVEAVAVPQLATFEAGVTFARTEGIVPAPESCHGIRAVIDEARRCTESGESKALFFNLSGHGHFDMASYDKYLAGDLEDYVYPEEAIRAALARLPRV
ncbi:TrpB-like pyridoxal phosphate-dependent enzyme [Laribacter hongkongensis]|uniref:Tryptophan synthase beta chain n=1 Tax=Laribacter hongkongensis (strain HLHK9) TaxID=557598 RepID=C1DBX4_LARHH|nr:TrpB-like pyridoxal phosphate-dependent enzyme [Laribacter hongkongensis]ACO75527.1 Pyridoxal-phosphate dependent TrpB-like enzyme [Laribacter hongkongensis HLHK9]MCG8996498.1 TrpB-like pyridoxal phosphate-dependent enzyme [Laribacter hongkongensis]MCG9011217.1 TrpB-like pyridoxal phosphate-dependent enzyme [Laribacter hongkongensis]MCG9024079.1 TrpB-like pyridoxal phosphate-dependent enzyme [Laribacter hongkongensis]MCG9048288.1 TrpB-like pyridoxal phosphate-dependent enzyme [Laribacter ho